MNTDKIRKAINSPPGVTPKQAFDWLYEALDEIDRLNEQYRPRSPFTSDGNKEVRMDTDEIRHRAGEWVIDAEESPCDPDCLYDALLNTLDEIDQLHGAKLELDATEKVIDTYGPSGKLLHDKVYSVLSEQKAEVDRLRDERDAALTLIPLDVDAIRRTKEEVKPIGHRFIEGAQRHRPSKAVEEDMLRRFDEAIDEAEVK